MKRAIAGVRLSLNDKSFDQASGDPVSWAAFERYLEILSEASRHLPDEWKSSLAADVPWRQIADLGNALRHGYDKIDRGILWSIYADDLGPLETAVDRMLAVHAPTPPPHP